MASNDWLGKIKSRAKSVQETAKNRLDKLSESLDKSLKDAQEDLDKQRSKPKSSESIVTKQLRWQQSDSNPDGEIIPVAKPPPIVPSPIQTITQTPIQTPSEPPQTPTVSTEPITILHRRKKPSSAKKNSLLSTSSMSLDPEADSVNERKTDFTKHNDHIEETVLSSSDVTSKVIDQGSVDKYSNELIDIKPTGDELVKNPTVMPIEVNIDTRKEEPISNETKLDQENVRMNIPTDKLTPTTNIDSQPVEHSVSETISTNIPKDELPTIPNTNDSPIIVSNSEKIPINIPSNDDELPTLTNNKDSPIEHSGSENISINILNDELPTITSINHSPIVASAPENIPINILNDELLALTNTDNSPLEHSSPESILINMPADELPPLTNIDNSPIEHSSPESIPINIPTDELTLMTDIDSPPIEHSSPESVPINIPNDKLPPSPNIDNSPIEHSSPKSIPINIPNDELPALTNTDHSPVEHSSPESIPINIPNDEAKSTNIVNSPIEHSSPESIPINISNDEFSTLPNIDNSPIEYFSLENISMSRPDDEAKSTNIDDSPIEHSGPENIPIIIPEDELPANANTVDSPIVDSDSEDIPNNITNNDDELLTSTNIADSPIVDVGPRNIQTEISDDEIPTERPDPENTLINTSDDEQPVLTNIADSSIVDAGSRNIQTEISDDEITTLTRIDDTTTERPDPENTLINTSDDEQPILTNTADAPIIESNLENVPINLSDDKSAVLKHSESDDDFFTSIDLVKAKMTHSESDDDFFMSTDIVKVQIKHSESDDDFFTSTDIVKVQMKHSDSNENHSMTTENNMKTSLNELEDSFDEIKMSNIQVQRPSAEPLEKLTDLAALRDFISKIEDDDDNKDEDEETIPPPKQDTNIVDKSIHTAPEHLDTSNMMKDTLSLSLSLTSLLDDTLENITNASPVRSDSFNEEPSIDETNEISSAMSSETKLVEKKRFPVEICHPVPSGTKISQMNCSSTYIYICTTDRNIFYAKLNLNDISMPFKWEKHTDLADRLVVSVSNRTVWRLLNKHLYLSNDPIQSPPIGSQWNEIKIDNDQSLLSMSINDECGWYIKDDGTLWVIRTDDQTFEPINVDCPFNLITVFCSSEKVGVTTNVGMILIRGCTYDSHAGDGWIFIQHNFDPIDDFVLLTNENIITIVDKNHHLWIHQWSSDKGFFEILCDDEYLTNHQRCLISVNSNFLCLTDCEEQIHIFSDCLTGIQWTTIEENTRLQRLVGAFANEDYVWALTTDKAICSSNGQILEKPRQAQFITHATFVPNNSSQDAILWSLDESCGIYVRPDLTNGTQWEPLDRTQFEWSRRLVHIVCNPAGVWAVDDRGCIYFRHGHISASPTVHLGERSLLPPAWITIPGEPRKHRFFSHIFCGPADWMVYATDNKQTVYTREGINDENRVGTSWKVIEDCSALELVISEHTLWLLTSRGHIQCRENISVMNPIGTRSTTLPGLFLSLTASTDDSQVWALDSKRNLLKLDRLTVLFEK